MLTFQSQTQLTLTIIVVVFLFLIGEIPMYLASRRSAITMLFQVIKLIFNSDNYNKISIFTLYKTNINFSIQKG